MPLTGCTNEIIPLTWGLARQRTNLALGDARLTWDSHVNERKANEIIPLTWGLPRQCTNLALGGNRRLTWDPHVKDKKANETIPLPIMITTRLP